MLRDVGNVEGHSRKNCRSKHIDRGKEFNNGPSKEENTSSTKGGDV